MVIFLLFHHETFFLSAHQKCLINTLPMSTHNICFHVEIRKLVIRVFLLFIAIESYFDLTTGLQIRVRNFKIFFLFLNQNICCGYSKNSLNTTFFLSTQNTCLNSWIRKKSHFYTHYKIAYLDLCVTIPFFIKS